MAIKPIIIFIAGLFLLIFVAIIANPPKSGQCSTIGQLGNCSGSGIQLPVDNGTITSSFGNRSKPCPQCSSNHQGVDIVTSDGNIYPVMAGIVDLVDKQGNTGAGLYVRIKHQFNGKYYLTRYLHLAKDSVNVNVGDNVNMGQVIAKQGNTGISTGNHLHFEVKICDANYTNCGSPLDPIATLYPTLNLTTGATWKSKSAHINDYTCSQYNNTGDTTMDCLGNLMNDQEWLARAMHFEAGGQGDLGIELVGNVILNRVKSDCFPDTIPAVIAGSQANIDNKVCSNKQFAVYASNIWSQWDGKNASQKDYARLHASNVLAQKTNYGQYQNALFFNAGNRFSGNWAIFINKHNGHNFYLSNKCNITGQYNKATGVATNTNINYDQCPSEAEQLAAGGGNVSYANKVFTIPKNQDSGKTCPNCSTFNINGINHKFNTDFGNLLMSLLNAAKAAGHKIGVTDSFRSYAAQVSCKIRKPNLCATPGKSLHGWGIAADLNYYSSSAAKNFIHQNAKQYGLCFPMSYEPWHIQPCKIERV